jgi:predicted TIM-barrel fold metal-dependent hydrolase
VEPAIVVAAPGNVAARRSKPLVYGAFVEVRHIEQGRGAFDWIGRDRILFASDYPHRDFDDPAHALPLQITETQRRQVFLDNANPAYGLA